MKFDLNKMMEQARKMQEDLKASQADLENIVVEADSGGGMVTVKANAAMKIINIEIEEVMFNPSEKEMVEQLIAAAINAALEKAKKASENMIGQKSADMLKNLNLNDLGKS